MPVYVVVFLIGRETNSQWALIIFAVVSFFIGVIIALISFDYILDKLIITNYRIIWVDWQSIFKREEHEAELIDIQDIETLEKGILSKVKFFDYGLLGIETAASKSCIIFKDCPNPEEVKTFILSTMQKQRGGIREKHEPPREDMEWSVN